MNVLKVFGFVPYWLGVILVQQIAPVWLINRALRGYRFYPHELLMEPWQERLLTRYGVGYIASIDQNAPENGVVLQVCFDHFVYVGRNRLEKCSLVLAGEGRTLSCPLETRDTWADTRYVLDGDALLEEYSIQLN